MLVQHFGRHLLFNKTDLFDVFYFKMKTIVKIMIRAMIVFLRTVSFLLLSFFQSQVKVTLLSPTGP